MNQRRAFLLMVSAAVLWGAGWPVLKLLSATIPTLHVMLLELLAASLFALAVYMLRKARVIDSKRLRIAAIIGLIEPGAAYLFFALGLANTTASSATIIDALLPLIIFFVARFFFGERFAPIMVPLIFVALIGTTLAVGFSLGGRSEGFWLGDVLVGLGMAIAAVHSVVMKRLVVEIDPVAITAVQQIVGAIVVGAAVIFSRPGPQVFLALRAGELGLIAAAGVLTIALPFVLYITAVRKLSAGSTGVAIAFIPVSGLTLSAVILKDVLTPLQIAGAGVTILALLLAARFEGRVQYVPR